MALRAICRDYRTNSAIGMNHHRPIDHDGAVGKTPANVIKRNVAGLWRNDLNCPLADASQKHFLRSVHHPVARVFGWVKCVDCTDRIKYRDQDLRAINTNAFDSGGMMVRSTHP